MKKMRRLIPAVAMLMVAAVMLSTASFAWFTMNTAVTASGMQIQAKADSSLIISEAPLTFDTGAPSVDFGATSATRLYPMTYGQYDTADGKKDGWVVPTNTAGINTATGLMVQGDKYKSAGATEDTHYVEKEVYIASAGAAMPNKQLTVTLTAPESYIGSAAKAYAAAIYVIDKDKNPTAWADDKTVDVDVKPTAVVFVDQAKDAKYTNGRHTVTLPGTFNIPSIVGVGEQNEETTGIKIIIRFYVDGDLTSVDNDKVTITTGYEYVDADGKFNPGVAYYAIGEYNYNKVAAPDVASIDTYYELVDNKYVLTEDTTLADGKTYYTRGTAKTYVPAIIPDGMDKTMDVLDTWFVRNPITESVNYKYIRTDDVPGTGTELEITFATVSD